MMILINTFEHTKAFGRKTNKLPSLCCQQIVSPIQGRRTPGFRVQGALPQDFGRKIIKLFSCKMSLAYYLLMMSPSQASSSSPCFSSGWPRLEYLHNAQKFTSRKKLWPPNLCKFSQNTCNTSKIEISALIGLDWNLFCLDWIGSGNFWLNWTHH